MRINIFSQSPSEIKAKVLEAFPAFRYRQLMHWLYQKHIFDLDKMSDLPLDFKTYVMNNFELSLPQIEISKLASDGSTKHRLILEDGALIEMVLIPDKGNKLTLCVSSQVGCARACSFCATGRLGLKRNLQTHEIVGQILLAASCSNERRLTNIVFMGMGEPLDNLTNVLKALTIIQAEDTLAFSPRRTTISTCGVVNNIITLADSGIKCKLAVSLNSAIDSIRDQLMPINRRYPLAALKNALQYYLSKSKFRVTFEYILIPEINMGATDLKALKSFVGDLSCKINFIPYNPVPHLTYRKPDASEIEAFMASATCLNQAITLRRSRGGEVCGACGQLAGT
ncbi:MAG: 23S rRNA (adenine(2503)-C(2))-methyltransferase RlmN [Candidatus Cloacimonadaceae bacterium]|jgi:23S rRNA (adenine2503-C2)-methyltransferase|nr:23S rRNA (adenine(2503)-C(2))-methyltransferase RlmN [Candidatus Cloacimonadaceae bacterium]